MAWRHHGKARVDPLNPQAMGICDRTGFRFNLVDLNYQFEYRGPRLMNTRLRVCAQAMDRPFIFNRPFIIPPDPVPVYDPRPERYRTENAGTNPLPPLPWPTVPVGPVDPNAPPPPDFVLAGPQPYLVPSPVPFVPPQIEPMESEP